MKHNHHHQQKKVHCFLFIIFLIIIMRRDSKKDIVIINIFLAVQQQKVEVQIFSGVYIFFFEISNMNSTFPVRAIDIDNVRLPKISFSEKRTKNKALRLGKGCQTYRRIVLQMDAKVDRRTDGHADVCQQMNQFHRFLLLLFLCAVEGVLFHQKNNNKIRVHNAALLQHRTRQRTQSYIRQSVHIRKKKRM